MQTPIAQIVALVTHGNAFLRGQALSEKFYPGNSTFQFCKEVSFVDLEAHGDHYHQHPYAADPLAFFDRLKTEGYTSLRLCYGPYQENEGDPPDWMMAGFVGGGSRWLLEARGPRGTDYWEARWETNEDNPEDNAIWHVSYGRIAKDYDSAAPGPGEILEVKDDFSRHLPLMIAFARRHDLTEFAATFETALALLTEDDAPFGKAYHKDLAPEGLLPLGAQRLVAAAQVAWVFGGMGSWCDLSFDENQMIEYANLSSSLYRILLAAIAEGANASA